MDNKVLILVGLLLLMLGLAACQGEEESAAGETAQVDTIIADESAGTAPVADYEMQAGGELTLTSGQSAQIVSVGEFDADTKAYEGLVVIEGRVAESYPERNTFMLVDCEQMEGCSDDCCPQSSVPVRFNAGEFEGELPQVDDFVMVVAEPLVFDAGYKLNVVEVRRDGECLLTVTASGGPKDAEVTDEAAT